MAAELESAGHNTGEDIFIAHCPGVCAAGADPARSVRPGKFDAAYTLFAFICMKVWALQFVGSTLRHVGL